MLRRDDPSPLPEQPLHGGLHIRPSLPEAVRAQEEAVRMLSDAELARLLDGAARMPVERARQVFVNRNLRLGNVEMVGFDMDYTLAIYHLRRIEQLSFDLTLSRLVTEFGYPREVGLLQYDHGFVMRGLVVDKA
ncbi:MAG TPA: 5'-nucleotidase domain-containing protein, partial [Myxococcaceae bacterium]|nr:5'-nucleotidase domain-containing protein [Myxococcaceae bacterium]